MSGGFLPVYALPVGILLSVPYIFLNNSYLHFIRSFTCFQSWLLYHPENAILRQEEDGINTIFRDSESLEWEGHYVRERKMLIGGKCFHVSSVFPSHPTATPTDKMLELIDAELKKDTRAG